MNFGEKFIELYHELSTSDSYETVASRLSDFIPPGLSITEFNLFLPNDEGYKELSESTSTTLVSISRHLEEEGILEWASEQNSINIIPDLSELFRGESLLFIYTFKDVEPWGFFIARTSLKKSEIDNNALADLKIILELCGLFIRNKLVFEEKTSLQNRIKALDGQLIDLTRLSSLGELAYSIASEFDAPINTIEAHLDLLSQGVGEKTTRIDVIQKELERINQLKRKLFEMTGFEPPANVNEKIDLSTLIGEVLEISIPFLERSGISTEFDSDNRSFYVNGYKPQLENAILCILYNCRKDLPEGGKISVGLYAFGEKSAVVFIRDSGIGYESKETESLFEPKSSATGQEERIYNPGLYIANKIIMLHRGKITVHSEKGRGTTYKIALPLA